jgi:hypothetical protein
MQFAERFWAIVNVAFHFLTFTPLDNYDTTAGNLQIQLHDVPDSLKPPSRVVPVPLLPNSKPETYADWLNPPEEYSELTSAVSQYPVRGPVFRPPGTPEDSPFQCDYSASMPDWEPCSTPTNRKCWLRQKSDWKQFDIYTDYEKFTPNGTTRYYNLDLADHWWAADGLNFTDAKLFNRKYPGPWIEACWGDR